MNLLIKPGLRVLCAVLCTAAILFFQSSVFAFPLANEIRPYGEDVIANGYARTNGNSAVFYTETYLDEPMENTLRAVYWDGNRAPISHKKLVYGSNPTIPETFEVIDYRRKRGYRVSAKNGIAKVTALRVAANGSETVRHSNNIPIDENTVIDASFHRYVVAAWDKVLAGKTVKINFLQVDRARLVPLKFKKTKCDSPANTCIKISFDNFLLQALVPAVYMKYETANKRLLRYNGFGPITELNGKGLPVDIVYEYM